MQALQFIAANKDYRQRMDVQKIYEMNYSSNTPNMSPGSFKAPAIMNIQQQILAQHSSMMDHQYHQQKNSNFSHVTSNQSATSYSAKPIGSSHLAHKKFSLNQTSFITEKAHNFDHSSQMQLG